MTLDPYSDPVTGVLINSLEIKSVEELSVAEAGISRVALFRFSEQPLPGRFDLTHLCAFHKAIFGDIYSWAGKIRTVAIAKSELFCLPQFIEPYATQVFHELKAENYLRDISQEKFIERLAYFFGEVNALHAFREGNGRTQRAFFGQLAREAGYRLRWELMSPDENIAASIAAMQGELAPLRSLLTTIVEPR